MMLRCWWPTLTGMAMCRVMEHRTRILAQLTIVCNPSLARRYLRAAGRKRKTTLYVALSLKTQSSGILPFQSVLLRFPAIWPNASLRHGSQSVRGVSRYPQRERASRGPLQIWRMSRILDEPRMRSYCATGLVASTCTWGLSEDVSRPRIATKIVDGDRHQLVLAKSASWSLEPGVTDQRAVELSKGRWCVA
ncbi:hypothetical protein BKA58DRAFT_202259 [Alternaria rosae]|uniref:uncharacterized protein n=1 Tax=Alternaria rosae TaxID=1187941 RepID=UPI001E8E9860|nr:uncharacterized protein BKA58DRAFT_202259 [Alternaria rosae]KAH6866294.1 hypothetical protein BKA58DRAFT_202259 [Alternaria rosae]